MAVPVLNWQPIRTAPTDGTVILLWSGNSERPIDVAYRRSWRCDRWKQINSTTKKLRKGELQSDWSRAHVYSNGIYRSSMTIFNIPTHWAPYLNLGPIQ